MIGTSWGVSREEREMEFPCDSVIDGTRSELFRGITVRASAATVFRWLCQLRLGSYSYTSGRRSVHELVDGTDQLEIGQKFMSVFGLDDFERDRHLTMRLVFDSAEGRAYGRFVSELALSYLIVPGDNECRLLLKYGVRYRSGPMGMLARLWLPWGDLIMARKQLMTLRDLAESSR